MRENVVLVGAGSAMFTKGMVADMIRHGWEGELRLVDIDPKALSVAERLAAKMLAAKKSPIKLSAATDRRKVLPGATAVICTIGVGGRRGWEQDVFIPRKHGIYQPVGDSVMPGGSSRALRMIPAMVAIAEDVLDLAPQALFFNYGNPMGPICRAVRKATGAEVVGLCHGVFHIAHQLAEILEVAPASLAHTAVGMNHLTWFTELSVDGRDLLPSLMAKAEQKLRGAKRTASKSLRYGAIGEARSENFIWELTNLFGAFPAVGDRHTTEFFPWMFGKKGAYYGKTLGIDAFSFENTIAAGDRIFKEMTEIAEASGDLPADYFEKMSGEHEQVIEIIESVRHGKGKIYSTNLPNKGQIPNLPPDAVVECPAIAAAGGLKPIQQRPLPSGIAGTLATRLQWVETVVEAALKRSRRLFVQALLLDGAVDSVATAEKLANELLAAQKAHLPEFE